jgi:alpha-N-arabinofuranosidase
VIVAIWSLWVIVFGVIEHLIDPGTFDNVWLGMWWGIETVTTVGYGDVVPGETAGKVIATFLMLGGLSLFAVVTAAITEYGVLPLSPYTGGDLTADSRFLKSLDHALFTASELVHWAKLGISIAARHTLVDFKTTNPGAGVASPPGFAVFGFAPSFTPSASAWVLDLFAHMTGDRMLRTRISDNPIHAAATGDYPELLALGSRDHRGRPSLIVVNRDPTAAVRATVSLPAVARRRRLQAWTVDGRSITAFNTAARPHAIRLTRDARRLRSSRFRWTFPAHSVTALRAVKPRARPSSKRRP